MGAPDGRRRVWEVDWQPGTDGDTPWAAYGWVLEAAVAIGASEVSIVAATYDSLGNLDQAIGGSEARALRVLPHVYRGPSQIRVRGVSRRGYWSVRGPVLVAWANDQVLGEVEAMRPPAIAAVASWPDDISAWRSVYQPPRIGEVRTEQEAQYATVVIGDLHPVVADAVDRASRFVNPHHAILDSDERELIAGLLIALRSAEVPIDADALRARLMAAGWNGQLITDLLKLAARVARGTTPRHRPFPI